MYLRQTQLFWGLSQEFVKQVMFVASSVALKPGDVIFHQDDQADFFYILVKGQVKLCPADVERDDCCGKLTGESFGWESLIDQPRYRNSAVCDGATILLKLCRKRMEEILEKDPYNAALFYRHLASALGKCLMEGPTRVEKKSLCKEHKEIHEFV